MQDVDFEEISLRTRVQNVFIFLVPLICKNTNKIKIKIKLWDKKPPTASMYLLTPL